MTIGGGGGGGARAHTHTPEMKHTNLRSHSPAALWERMSGRHPVHNNAAATGASFTAHTGQNNRGVQAIHVLLSPESTEPDT